MVNVSKVLVTFLLFSIFFLASHKVVLAFVLFSDNFDRANSTSLNNGWLEDRGDWSLNTEQLVAPVQDDVIVHNIAVPTSSNYYVQVDAKSSSSTVDTPDLIARFTDTNNFYLFQTDGLHAQLYKRVSGAWTLLNENLFIRTADTFNNYRLEVEGNQIRGFIDNNLMVSKTDDSLTANGFGGLRRGGSTVTITFDNFEIGDLPFSTPSPTATPTPTPTPTETPTPVPTPTLTATPAPTPSSSPVSKVVFIPGFGGSWNANAFASCTFDSDPAHWSLASYAADVYNPILTALSSSGWTTIPFYYDWRQFISNNANSLNSFINNRVISDEKVDLVGHSMGGLIGRQYLTNTSGAKLNKFLTAGSPHQGVPASYAAWSGGEVWEDNFITKIAMNLYLKHCSGLFTNTRVAIQQNIQSVNNLLPIFNYLKNARSGILKDFSSMFAQNTWHNNNNFDSHGVETETLSGYGYSTLQNIQIKDPSKTDIKNGNWLDGKPSGKIYSTNGDGTVLADSSTIPGITNVSLNQSHSGLVNSIDGMAEILRFLGIASSSFATTHTNEAAQPDGRGIFSLASSEAKSLRSETSSLSPTSLHSGYFAKGDRIEPTSALVIIGYPSNFWVTDQYGNIKKDSDGMVSFLNPKSGNFKLNLIPKTGNTLFVIAQFLPNGQIFYKEYNLIGFTPKNNTLRFSVEFPKEDILD